MLCNITDYVTMLYITSPWLIYLINESLYLLIPFTHFTHPHLPSSGNHQAVLCEFCFSGIILHHSYKTYGQNMSHFFMQWPIISLSEVPMTQTLCFTDTRRRVVMEGCYIGAQHDSNCHPGSSPLTTFTPGIIFHWPAFPVSISSPGYQTLLSPFPSASWNAIFMSYRLMDTVRCCRKQFCFFSFPSPGHTLKPTQANWTKFGTITLSVNVLQSP